MTAIAVLIRKPFAEMCFCKHDVFSRVTKPLDDGTVVDRAFHESAKSLYVLFQMLI
jgi:hypothetical protein